MAAIEGDVPARERIWQTIQELGMTNRVFSRQRIAAMTGLRLSVVDDHLERMRDDGKVIKVVSGAYELVPQFPAPVPISYTPLLGGLIKIERGDSVWELSPAELRLHAKMIAGWANELAGMEPLAEVATTVNRLESDVRRLKRADGPDCSCSSPHDRTPATATPMRRALAAAK